MSRFDVAPYEPSPAPFGLTALGLRASGVAAGIKPSGRPDVALLVFDAPVACAGVFTQNAFAAAPVQLCRAHLAASGGRVRALIVSSGNANACTGERGERDAAHTAAHVAALVGCPTHEVLVCSTGVIGVPLPLEKLLAGVGQAYATLASDRDASDRFLAAIQTTDAFRKEAAALVPTPAGEARVAGVCKGASMIEPDMATMLAFVGTDLALEPAALAAQIRGVAARSFNAVHVDTHASTNDTFLMFATGRVTAPGFEAAPALSEVAERLAWLIARDGEGATKVTRVRVRGAGSEADARAMARALAHSALVRTALFGNDPNWGRFVSAVGNVRPAPDPAQVRCTLQGVVVFDRGAPLPFDRAALSAAMQSERVELELAVGSGPCEATVLTSDLGYRYVEVNAEYTT